MEPWMRRTYCWINSMAKFCRADRAKYAEQCRNAVVEPIDEDV